MDIKKLYQQYSLNTYTRVGPVFVKGKGSWLWDDKGNKYLDLLPGWGVSILGHCHPGIVKVINQQVKKLMHLPNNLFFKEQALLAEEIVKKSFPAKVFFANSGAESIEGAIKFSRLFGRGKRYEIITMRNSFHGRTFGALSATAQSKYKKPFRPILAGFKEAKFNDFESFKSKVTPRTVAVLLELIQGEGGINLADRGYVKQLRQYCQKHSLLFIVDEVQTGMGRTGKLFAYQNYPIKPDIMVLSKGLGAGVPVSALVVNKAITDIIKPGMHASTFGGSPLVTRTSLEVFKIIERENLLVKAKTMGDYVYRKLSVLKDKYPFIKEVRGKGLMLGLELSLDAQPLFLDCLNKKLVINATHKTVLRMLPALNVSRDELDQGLEILESVFKAAL
ncbi:MAG: aspartate aminotransferase family protein [Candidatus Omnitrophica bacterium]|nr:aspartate aminotransferase family protein [Candidatus Omnitrophota bacterium]MBU2044314.1 aspartate aminotransferase family protein [Candidatus Omnitrophota bacterium]MBU2251268.1 aspartate aminotransferase family protein [Candidatus Omnitrophota bacterium]MBU2473331.1 aspartate aminotransferase family protein [Candidatus Omnitrophota bacterium]